MLEVVETVLACITGANLQQFGFVAAAWDCECDSRHFHFRWLFHNHFAEFGADALPDFLHGVSQQLWSFLCHGTPVAQCHASHHGAAPNVHVVYVHVVAAVVIEAEHVHVAHRLADDHALGAVVLEQPVLFLQFLGFLETQLSGEFLHPFLEEGKQFAGLSAEYLPDTFYISGVCLAVDGAGAASAALLYVVLQAQAPFALGYVVGGDGQAAGAHGV